MSGFVKVKTQDLSGAALDWAVAKAEGFEPMIFPMSRMEVAVSEGRHPNGSFSARGCNYSTDWSQGGPLIEKYRVSFATMGTGPEDEDGNEPVVAITSGLNYKACNGKTHLIAACRAIVAARLGDEVDVPEGLA